MKSITSKLLFGLSISISILLLWGAVFAAPANTLTIKCVDDSGKALAGARVMIATYGSNLKWQNKTADKDGIARYEKLDDGGYRVVVRPEAMAPGLYEPVILKNGAQESITVKCAAGDPLKKFYFEDPDLYQKAFETLKQAINSINQQKYDEADKLLQDSLAMNPSSPDTLFYLGLNSAQLKKWDLAQENFEKARDMATAQQMSLPPPKEPTKDAKGAPQQQQQLPWTATLNNAKAMLAMLPGLKLKVEGYDEFVNKNYKPAIAKLQEASKLIPNDPDTFYYLSLALGSDKQWEPAMKELETAIKLRPDDKSFQDLKERLATNATLEKAKGLADEGDTAYNNKDYSVALQKYEAALPLLPEPGLQASVWCQIGRARTQLKQDDAAIEAYKRAISLSPQDAKFKQALSSHYEVVAQRYINDKQYDQAFAAYVQGGISVFDQAKKWETNPETESLAIQAFNWIMKNDPQNAEAYFELGSVYYFKKDYAKAKENLNKYKDVGGKEHIQQASDILATIAAIEKKK
ncbi:MAG: tetratricopeptide repeat protein [Acidobacteriota bacterium]|jgi:tetratricopeptide (TPR) repeat protein